MLRTFATFDVRATWATVGLVFARTRDELLGWLPERRPRYRHSSYSHLNEIGEDERSDPLHYGGSLVARIRDTGSHEIATHTFSHYLCHEADQTLEDFEADIGTAVAVAMSYDVTLKSIVFPRNQVAPEYFGVLQRHGIRNYRGGVISDQVAAGGGQLRHAATRARRLLDTYLPLTHKRPLQAVSHPSGMTNVPASRFLRPYSPRTEKLEGLRLARIRDEMTAVAREGGIYHLWWHPHNFGTHLADNIAFLERVLEHFDHLRARHGMQSLTMAQAAEEPSLQR